MGITVAVLSIAATTTNSFTIISPQIIAKTVSSQRNHVQTYLSADSEGEDPELITNNFDENLASLSKQLPTSAADYLAAARKRAEEKRESVNSASSDDDWIKLAEQKKKNGSTGNEDGWEASLQDAGNAESQILIPMDVAAKTKDNEDDEEEEPKLLLF